MKRFCMLLILCSIFVFAACENSSNDSTDTAADADPTDISDTVSDNETGETDEDADTADTGDIPDTEEPDEDADTDPGLPECSPTSGNPCIDPETGFIWSSATSNMLNWTPATEYCTALNEGGYAWYLPSIEQLRSLIQNCDGDCPYMMATGVYSKLGDNEAFWSETAKNSTNTSFYAVDFSHPSFKFAYTIESVAFARCVSFDPCGPAPCESIENSDHICSSDGPHYICGCNEGYRWEDLQCKANPVCGSHQHLSEEFVCVCDDGYLAKDPAAETLECIVPECLEHASWNWDENRCICDDPNASYSNEYGCVCDPYHYDLIDGRCYTFQESCEMTGGVWDPEEETCAMI